MTRTSAIRDAWHPQTQEDRDDIHRELQEILASPHFCNSRRYPALLKYIVENTLAGNSEMLKERTLGVEVFDRPPSFDTNTDTVVRYTAGEVRKRLSLYYHEVEPKRAIQISLPPGSYIPEFLHSQVELKATSVANQSTSASVSDPRWMGGGTALTQESTAASELEPSGSRDTLAAQVSSWGNRRDTAAKHRWRIGISAFLAVVVITGIGWKYIAAHSNTPLNDFWAPVLRSQSDVMVCTGGSIFSQDHLSGVATAGKDVEYPFVSIQMASAIARLSSIVERNGGVTQLQAAASTPLTELRDRPIILLGGYNNQWTMRLLEPLPLHFAKEDKPSIVESAPPYASWARDASLPYPSADDYALIARFRDTTTGSWVVVLAGVGRNGSEAAAQFATSPHYMQMLRDRLGRDLSGRNVEVVLKVKVVDGKTGAPSIEAVRLW